MPRDDYPITTETEESGQFYDGPIVRVHVSSSDASPVTPTATEFAPCQQIFIATLGNPPTQAIQRRLRRYKASFVIRTGTNTTDIWFSTNPDALMPGPNGVPVGFHLHQGGSTNITNVPDYYGQQPLYFVSNQTGPIFDELSIIDMSYAEPDHRKK